MKIDIRGELNDSDELIEIAWADRDTLTIDKENPEVIKLYDSYSYDGYQIYTEDIDNLIKSLQRAKQYV